MEFLKAILKAQGLDDEKIEAIYAVATKEAPKHYIPKDVYNAKVGELATVTASLEAKDKELAAAKEFEGKYNTTITEFTNYKTGVEKEKANAQKKAAVVQGLKSANANPDAVDLLASIFDLDKVELDEKGAVKDWDNQLKSLKESKAGLFGTPQQKPNYGGFNPPAGGSGDPGEPKSLGEAVAQFYSQK
ncbi:phage scaffolding protein [Acetanaerobacterium elongatum]|uniref:Phage minor structural protein GP20 n=1 Tax=Acetanaerobacterium elongatum TaxID=258515 RepID=A0A1G9Z109_9FIRM|nr:phage scaffolding protein [Acetanaerobacterium elongatum]SDN14990.1 Phage minor structural protein GP20 [Acetanaerobacterium elongatum]